jgi:hypothetical protein
MFIRKVEKENVVCLTVNVLPYRVRLIRNKRREDPKMPHSRDNVIPISLPQVQMRFFSKKKNRLKPTACQKFNKFREQIFNNYLAVNRRSALQVYNDGSAVLFHFKHAFLQKRSFANVVCEKT